MRSEDGSNKLAPARVHLQDLHQKGKEGLITYHVVTPKTDGDGRCRLNEFDIVMEKATSFIPKPIDVPARLASNKPLAATEIGALLPTYKCLSPLALSNYLGVAFEVSVIPGRAASQAMLRPSQPKVVAVTKFTIPKGQGVLVG